MAGRAPPSQPGCRQQPRVGQLAKELQAALFSPARGRQAGGANQQQRKPEWTCSVCTCHNFLDRVCCRKCAQPRPAKPSTAHTPGGGQRGSASTVQPSAHARKPLLGSAWAEGAEKQPAPAKKAAALEQVAKRETKSTRTSVSAIAGAGARATRASASEQEHLQQQEQKQEHEQEPEQEQEQEQEQEHKATASAGTRASAKDGGTENREQHSEQKTDDRKLRTQKQNREQQAGSREKRLAKE